MSFLEELQKIDAQKRIDKLARKLKNKKVVIYGAGELATTIFENYDLSKLNIVAIVDRYFQQSDIKTKFGYKCLPPNDIKDVDFDIILVANANYPYFKRIIEDLLVDLNLANSIKILPLFKIVVRSKKRNILFSLIYNFAPPVHLIDKILDFLLKNFTIFVFDKKKRKNIIHRKKNYFETQIFGYQVLRIARSVGKGFFCGGYSSVTSNTILKERVSFNGMRIMGGGRVTIGRYFHSGIECLILSQNHNYDYGNAIPYDTTYIYKDVEIGDFVWLGSRVTILPGTKIGEGAIIQGGSVVHGEIPPYAIAGGNPAKVFKYRDIEHFEKLKAEGKFH